MNPLHITAECYRTFDRLDVDLPSGCVAIAGPNGAGKSSLLNAIDVALFAGRGELADLLTVGEDQLLLQLDFEHAGELYRVRRTFDGRGRGKTTLDFEQCDLDPPFVPIAATDWRPLTRETADATQQAICDTLGMSRTTFRASSFLRQGDGAAFTEASPRDRKAILAEILGLDVWDRLLDRARNELRGCQDELVKASGAIGDAADIVASKEQVTGDLAAARAATDLRQAELAEAEQALEDAQRERSAAAVLGEKVRACQSELQAAERAHEEARGCFTAAARAAHDLADKAVELGEVTADADRIPQLEATAAMCRAAQQLYAESVAVRDRFLADADVRDVAHARLVAQARALREEVASLLGKADHLEAAIHDSASCDRCGQTLGAEAAARAAGSYRTEAAGLDEKAAAIEEASDTDAQEIARLRELADQVALPDVPDAGPVEAELAAARVAGVQRAALAEKVAQLTELAAGKDEAEQAFTAAHLVRVEKEHLLAAARAATTDEAAVQARVERWRIAVEEARRLVDARRTDIVRAEVALERIAEAEARIAEHQAAVAVTQKRVDLLKVAERAFGRDGIPALIVESAAIPHLEVEANRILAELGTAFRVELRTQKTLKTSDALRETLDIVVSDGTHERGYETFSGGERTRLNLALRIALARLLANRRGAESRLLAIDEPEFLDEAGVARLADVLRGLAGDFDRVLLVSHHPTLAASFDDQLRIVKDGDRSSVDADALVAVAA